ADLLARVTALDPRAAEQRVADLRLHDRQQVLHERLHRLTIAVERTRDLFGGGDLHELLRCAAAQTCRIIQLYFRVRLELHCHSTCSDGSLAPEQVAQRLLEFEPELA